MCFTCPSSTNLWTSPVRRPSVCTLWSLSLSKENPFWKAPLPLAEQGEHVLALPVAFVSTASSDAFATAGGALGSANIEGAAAAIVSEKGDGGPWSPDDVAAIAGTSPIASASQRRCAVMRETPFPPPFSPKK